jgi:hypothetical protein
MNPQARRQNDTEASEVGEAFSLSLAEGERAGVGGIRPSSAAIWDWRPLRLGALSPSTGSALDGIANSDSGSRSGCACKLRPAVSVRCLWFPLTLALSLREREQPSCVFVKSGVAATGTVRSAIQGRNPARPGAFDPPFGGGRFSLSSFQGERECTTEVWCILRTR